MSDKRPIGVFDSGLGGLTVVKELIKALPNENIVYFGDTGRVPYGTRSVETIKKYAKEDEQFLLNQDVKLIIAACGTVSSVASDTADDLPVPFFEVVSHSAKAAVEATKSGKIAVIGTNATINSRQHEKEILKLLPSAQVLNQSCSLFVPLVEEGWYKSDDIVVLETVHRYLKTIIEFQPDVLILGCTHYPILCDAISKILGDGVTLINAGTAVATAVMKFLNKENLNNGGDNLPEYHYYVSDKPDSFVKLASILIGRDINENKVLKVDINNL